MGVSRRTDPQFVTSVSLLRSVVWSLPHTLQALAPKLKPRRVPVIVTVLTPADVYVLVASESFHDVTVPPVPSPHETLKLYVPSLTSGRRI